MQTALPTPTGQAPRARSPWLAFSVVAVGTFMATLDGNIVNVALPTIGRELGAAVGRLQWIVNAYVLAITVTLLLLGRPGDRDRVVPAPDARPRARRGRDRRRDRPHRGAAARRAHRGRPLVALGLLREPSGRARRRGVGAPDPAARGRQRGRAAPRPRRLPDPGLHVGAPRRLPVVRGDVLAD